jgi:hypothetical protein
MMEGGFVTKVVLDPVTRIEGHLRIDTSVGCVRSRSVCVGRTRPEFARNPNFHFYRQNEIVPSA